MLFFSQLILAGTDAAWIIPPTPNNNSLLNNSIDFRFSFNGTVNWSLSYGNGTWTEIDSTLGTVLSPVTVTWDSTGAQDGNYTINLTIREYNNYSNYSMIFLYNITIDNLAPNIDIDLPSNNSLLNHSEIFFNWSVTDLIDNNVSCGFYLDDQLNFSFGNETINVTLNLTEGNHTWYLNCSDDLNHTNISGKKSLLIDTIVPDILKITILPINYYNITHNLTNADPYINITMNESNLVNCSYSLDGSSWNNMSILGQYCAVQVPEEVNGSTLGLIFYLEDIVGFSFTSGIINLLVDDVAPIVNITTPEEGDIVTDDLTIYFNASIEGNVLNGTPCVIKILGGENYANHSITYNNLTRTCEGYLTFNNSAAFDNYQSFRLEINDSVNNTGYQQILLNFDNHAPTISSVITNFSNNLVSNNRTVFNITVVVSETTNVTNISVGNTTYVDLVNISPTTYRINTTLENLGCTSGVCRLTFYTEDFWGINDSSAEELYVLIDDDHPSYSNLTINESIVDFWQPFTVSALWADASLETNLLTEARLYVQVFNDTTLVDSMNLSNNQIWSNFTVYALPEYEGETLFYYINYTDLAGNRNITTNITVTVINHTPNIYNFTLLQNLSGSTFEMPTFSSHISDHGGNISLFALSNIFINLTDELIPNNLPISNINLTNTTNNYTLNAVCDYVAKTDLTVELGNYSFNYTNASYSISILNFSYEGTVNDTVTIRKNNDSFYDGINYLSLKDVELSFLNGLAIYVTAIYNDSGTIKANISFADMGYGEHYCNYTSPVNLSTGYYNATLFVEDSAHNIVNQKLSFYVDGMAPEIYNFSINNHFVIFNNSILNTTLNLTNESSLINFSWFITDLNFNQTELIIDGIKLYNESVGHDSTLINLAPGTHFIKLRAKDDIYTLSNTHIIDYDLVLYFNTKTNITKLRSDLINSISEINTYSIMGDSLLDNNQDDYLNQSIIQNITFNLSGNIQVSYGPIDALLFNWNASLTGNFNNNSAEANIIESSTGLDLRTFILFKNYSEGVQENLFKPTSGNDNVIWNINSSEELQIILIMNETIDSNDDFFVLNSTTPQTVNYFNQSYYLLNGTTYTIYSPRLTGIAYGIDAGAPNISIYNTNVNNSIFDINFSVIDPFLRNCTYVLGNGSVIYSTAEITSFDVVGTKNYYNKTFDNYADGVYILEVTCEDKYNNSATKTENITVLDVTKPVATVIQEAVGYYLATLSVSANELSKFRLHYGTDTSVSSVTSYSSSFSLTDEIELTSLSQNTKYYYKLEACDQRNNCYIQEEPSSFRTVELTTSGGSGGGGGGAMSEGMVLASKYQGWSELPSGDFEFLITEENIAFSKVAFRLKEPVANSYLEIKSYNGKPSALPTAPRVVYQYLQITHNNIVDSASFYRLNFKIPVDWLDVNSDKDHVYLYRYESGSWKEYPVRFMGQLGRDYLYEVDLPGFSFFAIAIDKFDPVEEVIESTDELPEYEEEVIVQSPDENVVIKVIEDEELVVGYDKQNRSNKLWFYLFPILLIIGGLVGFIYYKHKVPVVDGVEKELNINDPFYKLQVFILHALDKGYTKQQISESLVKNGWDEIIVDEEIDKLLLKKMEF